MGISYYHENHLCDFLSDYDQRKYGSIEDLLKLITKCDLDNITNKDLEELAIDSFIMIEHERWENDKDFNIDKIEFENKISKKRKKELFEKIEEQLEESGEEDVYDMWGYEDDVEITDGYIRVESIIVKTGESPDEAEDYNKNKVYEFRN